MERFFLYPTILVDTVADMEDVTLLTHLTFASLLLAELSLDIESHQVDASTLTASDCIKLQVYKI